MTRSFSTKDSEKFVKLASSTVLFVVKEPWTRLEQDSLLSVS